jgi:hypothetical protein
MSNVFFIVEFKSLLFVQVNLKIVCRDNFKYEVHEKSPAAQALSIQQLAEEYWR